MRAWMIGVDILTIVIDVVLIAMIVRRWKH